MFAERLVETSRNNYNYSQHEYHQQGAASTFRESSFTGRGNKLSWSKEMDYFTNHNSR